jgi:hypothetical protein
MPRKQRFKPTRKPKPVQASEDAVNGDALIGHRVPNSQGDAHPRPTSQAVIDETSSRTMQDRRSE